MSIVNRKEFADLCRIDLKKLNVYISRGKVFAFKDPDDGLSKIDTETTINKIFKEKCLNVEKEKAKPKVDEPKKDVLQEIIDDKVSSQEKTKIIIVEEPPKPKRVSKATKEAADKQNQLSLDSTSLDLRKKRADAEKAELSAQKEKLTIDRMQGRLLPVDLVEMVLSINIQGIFKEFESEMINLASIYTDILAGGDRGKLAEVIEKVREKINTIITKTEETTTNEIQNAVDDYISAMNRN